MHRGKQILFSTQSRKTRKVVTPYLSWRSLLLCVRFLKTFFKIQLASILLFIHVLVSTRRMARIYNRRKIMSMNIFIIIIGSIYIFDVFLLIWISGRFAGIRPLTLSQIGAIGLAIILFSWLCVTAFIHVPMIVKPLILIISSIITVCIFITSLEKQFLRALAAGSFFVLCQFVIFIFLLQKFWYEDFFQIVKLILFNYY